MEAYPLHWPAGWTRCKYPQHSRFACTFASARDSILHEIHLMGGRNPIISTNNELRRDGLPYANARQPEDKSVAVYFTYKNEQVVFACDKWNKIEHNLQAIRKTIEAMRGVERWGVSDMLKRAFTGFKALPENESVGNGWWEILEVDMLATSAIVKTAYYNKAKKFHPDNQETGDAEKFKQIKAAYDVYNNAK